jgi:hypothetical protein
MERLDPDQWERVHLAARAAMRTGVRQAQAVAAAVAHAEAGDLTEAGEVVPMVFGDDDE